MRVRSLLLIASAFVLLVTARSVTADDEVHHPDVTILTSDNFEDFISAELSLVEFYAPWCGHCKTLAPEYGAAATQLKKLSPTPVLLGKVDATQQAELAQQFGVTGYPTLKVFRNGKPSDYNGPRVEAGIVSYMSKQIGAAAKVISTAEQLTSFLASDPISHYTVIGVFGDSDKPTQLQAAFTLLANKLREEFVFGKTHNNNELLAAYGITAEHTETIVAIYNNGEDVYIYDTAAVDSSKQSSVESFVRDHSLPVVGLITADNSELYSKKQQPIVKLFMKVDKAGLGSKAMKYYVTRMKKIAAATAAAAAAAGDNDVAVLFAIADKAEHARQLDDISSSSNDFTLLIEDKGKVYKYEAAAAAAAGKFDVAAYSAFVQQFAAKQLKPYIKSEAEPTDDTNSNSNSVKIVTGNNFASIVTDSQNVLLEFYAPWCGHCKSLAPKLDALALALAAETDSSSSSSNNSHITIAKLDATANDYDNSLYDVKGYPTVYFKPAGVDSVAVKYEGEREVEAMMKYVKKNAVGGTGGGGKKRSSKNDL